MALSLYGGGDIITQGRIIQVTLKLENLLYIHDKTYPPDKILNTRNLGIKMIFSNFILGIFCEIDA